MADPKKRLPENVPGDFFVDSTCIDCGTCRFLAPVVFDETTEFSFVKTQPQNDNEERQALQALVSCPTGSIGTEERKDIKSVMSEFPLLIDEDVYYCGFASPKSFGASSYFIKSKHGNWLIDSPKFLPQLVEKFESIGGIDFIFLSHRDDVADAPLYAKHFGSKRIIHEGDLKAQPEAEIVVHGQEVLEIAPQFQVIPTPGHTRGHQVLLYRSRYLFTGDHLAWDAHNKELEAFRDFCWYSWGEQAKSMSNLLNYRFQWVLPGHGRLVHLEEQEMQRSLKALVDKMLAET